MLSLSHQSQDCIAEFSSSRHADENQPLLPAETNADTQADENQKSEENARGCCVFSNEYVMTSMKLLACCGGIVFLLGIYGFLQERIMTIPYDKDATSECEENPGACIFKWSLLLVFFNRIMTVVFALIMTFVKGDSFLPKCPLWKYGLISFSNVLSTTCQYEALKFISFPMQTLGKSFKMVPVMVWGIIVSGKKYKYVDWIAAMGVTLGCAGFALFGDVSSRASAGSSAAYLYAFGMCLMMGYLMSDAFTSTFQEYLFKSESTTKYNQMLYINSVSAVLALCMMTLRGGFSGY